MKQQFGEAKPLNHLLVVGALFTLAGCGPAMVEFVCEEDEPLCTLAEVLADERPLATGVDITGVYLYQGPEYALMEDGEAIGGNDTPLVAGRLADLRVAMQVHEEENWVERDITGRVFLYQSSDLIGAYQSNVTVSGAAPGGYELYFDLPGSLMLEDLQLQVGLYEASAQAVGSGEPGLALWPEGSRASIAAQHGGREGSDWGGVRIHLVPIEFSSPQGTLMPDTSDEQMEIYRQTMLAHYPITEVEITLGDTMSWSSQIDPMGTGWSELLSAVGASRSQLGVDDDVYIFGVFTPETSFEEFCSAGCVAGLSNLVQSAGDSASRASIGLGYGGAYGESSAATMVHEVGHAHGLSHASGCGADGVDPNYPDPDGLLDVDAYDVVNHVFKDKHTYYDMMSYCTPTFISAYHYGLLFRRVTDVNAMSAMSMVKTRWYTVWQHSDGHLAWGQDRLLAGAPSELVRWIELLDDQYNLIAEIEARFVPFSDLGGGALIFPEPDEAVVYVAYEGEITPLRR